MADSDLINALSTTNRSSSVLQGIANPPQVNPLAAIMAGNQAAQAEFNTRSLQAQQTLGAILQQSTDANGNVDYQKAHTLAAQAGPIVQMGMAKFAGDASQLRGQQIGQAGALHQQVGAWSAALMLNPSDAMLDKIDGEMAAAGYPAGARAEIARLRTLSEPERQQEAYRHSLAQTDALYRLAAGGYPTPVITQLGGTSAPITVTPGSPYGNAPGMTVGSGVGHTVSPETYYSPQSAPIMLDANNQPTDDPSKAVRSVPRDVPRGPAMGVPAPGSVSGSQFPPKPPFIPSDATSGAPGLPPGAPPPPPGQRLVGGKFVTPPAATPSPTQPLASAAPPASPAPAGGGVVTGLPTGTAQTTEDSLRKDVDARTAANTAMGDQQKRLIAGQAALDALKLADTGPSTGFFAKAYAFLKAQGITTVERGQLSDTDYRQLLQKNLLRFAQDNGSKAGTDLGLETKLHSNANADEMLAGANRHVLIQDMGVLKRDITQTQEMPEPSPTGAVVKHLGSFPANTAPEAFMWNHYTRPERNAIEKEYEEKGQTKRLHDSLSLAVKRGAIPDPRKAAPTITVPAAPPRPAPNALIPPAAPP